MRSGLELILLMLAASTGLRIVAERGRVPYATLLVLGGLGLAAIPTLPRISAPPDVLFLVFVPPLLYWSAASFPLRDFRRASGPILRLAVLMVLVTCAAVAVVIHAIDPRFTWPAAFALGAIVAPPDPVAVVSLLRSLRLPREIERVLEGEGLLNDASALVLYRVAVMAAVTNSFSPGRTAVQFLIVGLGGAAVGLAAGAIVLRLRRITRRIDVADSTLSLLTPFAVYLAAEALECSGVIAVVAAAMYIGRHVQATLSPASRLQNGSMWTVVTFLLESLAFILVGIELPLIVRHLDRATVLLLMREAAVVFACMVVVRIVWVFPSAYVGRLIGRWARRGNTPVPSWQRLLFVGFAGVRGADSLVIALALPLTTLAGQPFPARERILFITFCVIFVTLLIQAPALRPLARWLNLGTDASMADEEVHARLTSAEAALRALDRFAPRELTYPEVARYLRQRYRQRARRWAAQEARQSESSPNKIDHRHSVTSPPSHEAGMLDEQRGVEYARIRFAMILAERRAVIGLRDDGIIGDDVLATLQRELDFEQILLEGAQPVGEPPREVRLSSQG
ncbi:MAG TPA: Na+/H+ antiporter [Gemmatimonadaceae bacterium]|nr:Na+/H+ antiporter [Gemmatimonadaceae bacterium]